MPTQAQARCKSLVRKQNFLNLESKMLEHTYVFVCVFVCVVSECAPTRGLPPTSPSLAGWPGGCWEEGPALLFLSLPLAAARAEAQLEGLLLLLALAGPAGRSSWRSQERSAPPPSWVLCCLLCLTSQGKKIL